MKKAAVGLWTVGAILLVVSLVFLRGDSARYDYTGTEVFRLETEYTAFKEVMTSPELTIEEVQTLSSAPPILVDFHVQAPKGLDFPYGKRSGLPFNDGLFGSFFALGIVACLFGFGFLVAGLSSVASEDDSVD